MDPSGKEDASFTKASMAGPTAQGPDRPLAADLAVEPVSMLVMFNRLQTPEKLQDALNKKPGQFSHLVAVAGAPAGGVPSTGAPAVAGSVAAVPTDSAKEPGLQATP